MVASVALIEEMSSYIWTTLRRVAAFPDSFREETLTDWNLLKIWEAANPDVRVYKASGTDESRMGFDWEWYIGAGGRWWQEAHDNDSDISITSLPEVEGL